MKLLYENKIYELVNINDNNFFFCFCFCSGIGDGNGKDLSFEIIINGSTVTTLHLANSRQGQVRECIRILHHFHRCFSLLV